MVSSKSNQVGRISKSQSWKVPYYFAFKSLSLKIIQLFYYIFLGNTFHLPIKLLHEFLFYIFRVMVRMCLYIWRKNKIFLNNHFKNDIVSSKYRAECHLHFFWEVILNKESPEGVYLRSALWGSHSLKKPDECQTVYTVSCSLPNLWPKGLP